MRYLQLKVANTHGDLDALGFGIKINNLALIGAAIPTGLTPDDTYLLTSITNGAASFSGYFYLGSIIAIIGL